VTIGLAGPFARPARTLVTLAAIVSGVTAVIFAAGLRTSLSRAQADLSHAASEQVQVLFKAVGMTTRQTIAMVVRISCSSVLLTAVSPARVSAWRLQPGWSVSVMPVRARPGQQVINAGPEPVPGLGELGQRLVTCGSEPVVLPRRAERRDTVAARVPSG
jgi:hypothetical protein